MKLFQQARTVLTKKYEFQLLATYQNATTSTALVDVVFDFRCGHWMPSQLARLAMRAEKFVALAR